MAEYSSNRSDHIALRNSEMLLDPPSECADHHASVPLDRLGQCKATSLLLVHTTIVSFVILNKWILMSTFVY